MDSKVTGAGETPDIVPVEEIFTSLDETLQQLRSESHQLSEAGKRAKKKERKRDLNTRAAALDGLYVDLVPAVMQLLSHCSKEFQAEREAAENEPPF